MTKIGQVTIKPRLRRPEGVDTLFRRPQKTRLFCKVSVLFFWTVAELFIWPQVGASCCAAMMLINLLA